jgi:hypothetical protein
LITLTNYQFENTGKEAIMVFFKVLSQQEIEGTEEIHEEF